MGKNFPPKYTITIIEWEDSYGALSGWTNLEDYNPKVLECVSCGIVVFEDKKVVALAPNYATSTTYTPTQGNGLMVIPKSCIKKITSYPYSGAGSRQRRRQT